MKKPKRGQRVIEVTSGNIDWSNAIKVSVSYNHPECQYIFEPNKGGQDEKLEVASHTRNYYRQTLTEGMKEVIDETQACVRGTISKR